MIMARNIFKGLGIALVTPFTASGAVDYAALKRLVQFQLDNGADFLCILATTGETPTLTTEEKTNIKNLVIELVKGRVPILMGCGGNNTAAVVEELRTADWHGIDGVWRTLGMSILQQAITRGSLSAFQGYCLCHFSSYSAL